MSVVITVSYSFDGNSNAYFFDRRDTAMRFVQDDCAATASNFLR